MGRFAAQDRTIVASDQIPQHVKDAIVAAEDRTFYENRGVSPVGLARAVWGQVSGDYAGGGSTITQQYVKNYYLNFDQTYTRKAKEAIIALKIDQQQSQGRDPHRLPQHHLLRPRRVRHPGGGAGVLRQERRRPHGRGGRACWPASSPTRAAGTRRRTRRRRPSASTTCSTAWSLGQTLSEGQRDPMVVPTSIPEKQQQTYAGPNGYLLAMVRSELLANSSLTETDLDTGGLRITTTISRNAAGRGRPGDGERAPSLPGRGPAGDAARGARPRSTRRPAASWRCTAARTTSMRQSNAATQDVAQAGSTFKPFTLVAALENEHRAEEHVGRAQQPHLRRLRRLLGQGAAGEELRRLELRARSPGEGDGELGQHRVRRRSTTTVGPEKTREVAVRAGLPEDTAGLDDFLSNVLGTASPHPIDMAAAYSTFAAQGVRHDPAHRRRR